MWTWKPDQICVGPALSTNTTPNIMKGVRYNEINSGDTPNSNSERIMLEPKLMGRFFCLRPCPEPSRKLLSRFFHMRQNKKTITMFGNMGHQVWNRWILFRKNIDGT